MFQPFLLTKMGYNMDQTSIITFDESTRLVSEICNEFIPKMEEMEFVVSSDMYGRFDSGSVCMFTRENADDFCLYINREIHNGYTESVRLYYDFVKKNNLCFVIDTGIIYRSYVVEFPYTEEEYFQRSLVQNMLIPHEQYLIILEMFNKFQVLMNAKQN